MLLLFSNPPQSGPPALSPYSGTPSYAAGYNDQALISGALSTAVSGLDATGWTLEFWLYRPSGSPLMNAVGWYNSAQNIEGFLGVNASGTLVGSYGSGGTGPSVNTWTHIAIEVRADGAYNYFVNGQFVVDNGDSRFTAITNLYIGDRRTTGNPWVGGIDEVRLSKGGRYPFYNNFTPPSAPLSVDSSTVALWRLNGNGNPANPSLPYNEPFSDTNALTWLQHNQNIWQQPVGGVAGTIQSNSGYLTTTNSSDSTGGYLPAKIVANSIDTVFTVLNTPSSEQYLYAGVGSSLRDYYYNPSLSAHVRLTFGSGTLGYALRATASDGTAVTIAQSSKSYTSGTNLKVRFRYNAINGAIMMRSWLATDTEPSTWDLSSTTNTGLGGVPYFGMANGTGSVARSFTLDDVTFSDYTSPSVSGQVKVYIGSAFVAKPVKIWNGTGWVVKPAKVWTGTAWKTTTY